MSSIGIISRPLHPGVLLAIGLAILLSTACFSGPSRPAQPGEYALSTETLKRAEGGDAAAQLQVGYLYLSNGAGTPNDPEKAKYWWNRAYQQKYLPASMAIAVAYETGNSGYPHDAQRALIIYREVLLYPDCALSPKQALLGCMRAASAIARLTDVGGVNLAPDPTQVRAAYVQAARYHAIVGQRLAVLYRDGIGGEPDNTRAYFWALSAPNANTIAGFRARVDDATAAAIEAREAEWNRAGRRDDPFAMETSRSP